MSQYMNESLQLVCTPLLVYLDRSSKNRMRVCRCQLDIEYRLLESHSHIQNEAPIRQ
uniref:Uncharacterized protein n=1 Tax=Ascaris lumbricoides TaxID=6252 RepID=A0A0M3HGD8_ASCLU